MVVPIRRNFGHIGDFPLGAGCQATFEFWKKIHAAEQNDTSVQ